ncbi:MAG: hypothetical protein EBX52_10065 [Proteobacteria bacterium]|nr:hypothetical protein [Pseudomonadota bacterium]
MNYESIKKWISPLLAGVAGLTGCAHGYDKTAAFVDRDRYMGTWYVQAGRFTSLENDAYNATEIYRWNEAEERIDIVFHFNKGSFNGPLKSIPQKAWIADSQTHATWKVSPFWPLKFTYLILLIDPDYQWTVVGVPSQSYLWVMSRKPRFPKEETLKILKTVEEAGYSTRDIVFVQHSAPAAP